MSSTKALKQTLKKDNAHADDIWSLAFTSTGSLLSGSLDGTVKCWAAGATDVKCEATSEKRRVGVTSIATTSNASSSANIAAVCYQDSIIKILNGANLKEIGQIEAGLLEAYSLCIWDNPDGNSILFSGAHNGHINIWSLGGSFEKTATLPNPSSQKMVMGCAIQRSGRLLATVGADGFLSIYDIQTSQFLKQTEAHAMPIRSVAFSPDGNLLYTASDDRYVSVYDTVSGSVINSFCQTGMAYSVDPSPDQRHFAVGCADSSVRYWDLGMQSCIQEYGSHRESAWSVKFDQNKGNLASAGADEVIQFYS
jgi:WD repeat-containing protein 61